MLTIVIPEQHYKFLNDFNEFVNVDIKEITLKLEHSLISVRKWEQKHHKPFLSEKEKTQEEMIDYVRCMTLSPNIDENVYNWIPNEVMNEIVSYIQDPMTATWFSNNNTIGAQKTSKEVVTAEIIYYWMISLSIPLNLEKWHLSQLLTLIKVIYIKNNKQERMDPKVAAKRRAALNAARRAKYNSKG